MVIIHVFYPGTTCHAQKDCKDWMLSTSVNVFLFPLQPTEGRLPKSGSVYVCACFLIISVLPKRSVLGLLSLHCQMKWRRMITGVTGGEGGSDQSSSLQLQQGRWWDKMRGKLRVVCKHILTLFNAITFWCASRCLSRFRICLTNVHIWKQMMIYQMRSLKKTPAITTEPEIISHSNYSNLDQAQKLAIPRRMESNARGFCVGYW